MTVDYWLLTISVVGLVLAHAANNMINDYFDSSGGVDTRATCVPCTRRTRSCRAG